MKRWVFDGISYQVSSGSRVWNSGGFVSFKVVQWQKEDHPRGSDGRFIQAGDRVTLPGGGSGRVVAVIPGGRVAVQADDGKRAIISAGDLAHDSFDPESYYALPEPKWSNDEEKSVMFYRGNGYQEINRHLRENEGDLDAIDDPTIKKHIASIDRAIARNKLDRPLTVYRALSPSYARDLTPEAELDVMAFSSTSLSRAKAEEFGSVVMQIDLPKGASALKAFDGDFEVLLPRDVVLIVDRVENGTIYVRPD